MRPYPHHECRVFFSSSSPPSDTRQQRRTQVKIPIPKSSPTTSTSSNPFASIDVKAISKASLDMTLYVTKAIFRFIINLPSNTVFFITHPKERREKIAGMKETIKKEVDHYWVGFKVSFVLFGRQPCLGSRLENKHRYFFFIR
jgi:hypothetical protein